MSSCMSSLRRDFQNIFSGPILDGVFLRQRGSLAIFTDHIKNDLFDGLDKRQESRYHYPGKSMNRYIWTEAIHTLME